MKRKILIITAMLAVMVAMTGIGAADYVNIYNGLPYEISNKVANIDLVIGGSAVQKDLVVDTFLNPINTGHTLTYIVADPDGAGPATAGDIIIEFKELNPNKPSGGSGYSWTQESAPGPGTFEKLGITFQATNNAKNNLVYPIHIIDSSGSEIYEASAWVTGTPIPEFPTVALPIAAVIGLVFLFQQKKNKKE